MTSRREARPRSSPGAALRLSVGHVLPISGVSFRSLTIQKN